MWSGGAPLFPQYIQKSRSLFSSHYCSAWRGPTFLSSAPLQVGLSVYFIWDLLGPSVLVGKTTSVNCKRTVLVIVVFTKVLFCDLDYVLFTTGMTSLRTGSSCDLSTTECFGTYYYLHPKTLSLQSPPCLIETCVNQGAVEYALSAMNVRGSCKIWFSPQGLVHHGPIPDTADGAKGHKGEPCQWDPQWDQGTNLVWKRKGERKKKVKNILDKVLKMYAWEQPFMEMIGDIRQDSDWIPTRRRFFIVDPPSFNKNQVQEGRDNCFETVPVLGRHSGDLTQS